jgi:hypothetical protein
MKRISKTESVCTYYVRESESCEGSVGIGCRLQAESEKSGTDSQEGKIVSIPHRPDWFWGHLVSCQIDSGVSSTWDRVAEAGGCPFTFT